MSGHGGARPGAGRPNGLQNKLTLEVRELALQHGPAALAELVKLSKKAKSESVRLAAIREILDRSYGRSPQAMEIMNLTPEELPSDAELAALIVTALEEGAAEIGAPGLAGILNSREH